MTIWSTTSLSCSACCSSSGPTGGEQEGVGCEQVHDFDVIARHSVPTSVEIAQTFPFSSPYFSPAVEQLRAVSSLISLIARSQL
jgi:hypothetical protein